MTLLAEEINHKHKQPSRAQGFRVSSVGLALAEDTYLP